MKRHHAVATALGLLILTVGGFSRAEDGLPPVTPDLIDISAVACVKIGDSGEITDAFLIQSLGSPERDGHLLEWIRQLRWPAEPPGSRYRNIWLPMPVSTGSAAQPAMPATCGPAKSEQQKGGRIPPAAP